MLTHFNLLTNFFQQIKELESDNKSKMAELRRLRQEKAELQAMLQNHLMVCPSLLLQTGWISTVDKFVNYRVGLHVEFNIHSPQQVYQMLSSTLYVLFYKCIRSCGVHCVFCSTSVSEVIHWYIMFLYNGNMSVVYVYTMWMCICVLSDTMGNVCSRNTQWSVQIHVNLSKSLIHS